MRTLLFVEDGGSGSASPLLRVIAGRQSLPSHSAVCTSSLLTARDNMVTLPVLHFNDVYRVQPFKPSPSSHGTIDVTQWTAMLDDIRQQWAQRPDGKREGLVLFSGDVFSPSTESSVTRGSHMVCANHASSHLIVIMNTREIGPSHE